MDENKVMSDLGAVLRNRANNDGRLSREYLILAAEAIEMLQHRVRYGDWPKPVPMDPDGNLE
jgi:hypothetical protein